MDLSVMPKDAHVFVIGEIKFLRGTVSRKEFRGIRMSWYRIGCKKILLRSEM